MSRLDTDELRHHAVDWGWIDRGVGVFTDLAAAAFVRGPHEMIGKIGAAAGGHE